MRAETEKPKSVILEISRFYDIAAEEQFVHSLLNLGVSRQQVEAYLRENVGKFLLEFAAGVRKTSITYHLGKDGRLYYSDFTHPIADSFERAATLAGEGSREHAEFLGWLAVERAFQAGAEHVLQLSPPDRQNPQHGNYGFVFWFERQGESIVNHILRYDEDKNSLTASHQIATKLATRAPKGVFSARDCLLNPLVVWDDRRVLLEKLASLGFDIDTVGAQELEKAIWSDQMAKAWLLGYINGVLDGENQQILYGYLGELYNLAVKRAEALGFLERLPRAVPPIFFGGSCPVVGKMGMSVYSLADWLLREPFECPNCGYISFMPVGDTCPSCRITKDEWAEKAKDTEICD